MVNSVEITDTAFPLELVVNRDGTGGVTGLTPTVAVRDATTTNSYLDWGDHTFKTSGWSLKYAPMSETERGGYLRILNVAQLAKPVGTKLSVEYRVVNGTDVGDDADLLTLVSSSYQADITFLKKHASNRMEALSGSPGHLVLYDDDSVTPLLTWQVRDEAGGAINPVPGTPALRSKGS